MGTRQAKAETEQQPKNDESDASADLTPQGPSEQDYTTRIAELEKSLAEMEERNAELVGERAQLRRVHERAAKLKIGETLVLDEDKNAGTELVLVHRKRSAKPTGRFVPKHHVRFWLPGDATEAIATLTKEGAIVVDGNAGTKVVQLRPHMKPLEKGERAPAYSMPSEPAAEAMAKGWVEEEVA